MALNREIPLKGKSSQTNLDMNANVSDFGDSFLLDDKAPAHQKPLLGKGSPPASNVQGDQEAAPSKDLLEQEEGEFDLMSFDSIPELVHSETSLFDPVKEIQAADEILKRASEEILSFIGDNEDPGMKGFSGASRGGDGPTASDEEVFELAQSVISDLELDLAQVMKLQGLQSTP